MPQVDDGWGPGPGTGAHDQMGSADGWGSDPWQPAQTGPLPSVGGPGMYEEPVYTEPPGQEWLEASHDDGMYYQEPQWEDLPEPDPRYPVPGPGMPGYPGARDHRYGGDRY